MSVRSRRYIHSGWVPGQPGGPIAVAYEVPWNCQLIQWSLRFNITPVTPENFMITRDSQFGANFDIDYVIFDPTTVFGFIQRVCNPVWEFQRGDFLRCTYTNTDAREIGIEIILTEA